jgi:hypothetical protein
MKATKEDLLALRHCESYKGCCDTSDWRGNLCTYHQGWLAGFEVGQVTAYQQKFDLGYPTIETK